MEFMVQLVDFFFGFGQGLSASGRDPVNPPVAPINLFEHRLQQPTAFQAMQQRVQGSGPNAIAVMRQLPHHGQSKNRLMRSVHQHVDPYQPEEEFSLFLQHRINIRPWSRFLVGCYRISI